MKYAQTQTQTHTPLRIPHKRLSNSISICTEIKSHYSDKLLARLITGWQTCSWPAAASIFCLDCRVEEEEVETARLCLSHRTSSHIQDSCKINTRTLVKLEEAIYLIPQHHSKSVHKCQSALSLATSYKVFRRKSAVEETIYVSALCLCDCLAFKLF